jgi:hypothetical protein
MPPWGLLLLLGGLSVFWLVVIAVRLGSRAGSVIGQ